MQFASGNDFTESGWEYNICCIDCVLLFVCITQFAMDIDCLSLLIVYCFFNLLANGLNNSQRYWANNVGSCCVRLHVAKSLTGFKLCAATRNNMQQQQGVQTNATCNIQQCWELLANNVASVSTIIYNFYSKS